MYSMLERETIPLYTAAEVRELDRLAVEALKIPEYELMCRAGDALVQTIVVRWPQAKSISILCGPGNNAGDGYVLAKLLRDSGKTVQLLTLSPAEKLNGAARKAADAWVSSGGTYQSYESGRLTDTDLIVDAMLGSGLDRPLEEPYKSAIEEVNALDVPVLCVDIPSGLHADTGKVLGVAVEAQCTLTFIGRKQGLYTADAVDLVGDIEFSDLRIPDDVYSGVKTNAQLLNRVPSSAITQPRKRSAHKGDFGHVLVVGGNKGMAGAARLAAQAAARCGAGLVTVATHTQHVASLNQGCPELMVHAVEQTSDLDPLLDSATVVVIGPGLGLDQWSRNLFEYVLDKTNLPLVVDADALNLLAQDPTTRNNWILTPHPGEAARLLNQSISDVQSDRFAAVHALQDKFGGVAVLKGAGSLIVGKETPVYLCNRSNPGMASGGMGDVLSGVIGALLAQGLEPLDAANTGVFVHANAADVIVSESGERGLLASDLIPEMRKQINESS